VEEEKIEENAQNAQNSQVPEAIEAGKGGEETRQQEESSEKDNANRGKGGRSKDEEEEKMEWEDNMSGMEHLFGNAEEEGEEEEEEEQYILDSDGEDENEKEEDAEDEVEVIEILKNEQDGKKNEQKSITERAREYVKEREKAAEERRKVFVEKLKINKLEYKAIQRSNIGTMKPLNAMGERGEAPKTGSFPSQIDERLLITKVSCCMEMKKTVTTSFDINTLECQGCVAHDNQPPWRKKGAGGPKPRREAFILSDQSYPPMLPTESGMQYIKIIRREFASTNDLVTEFLTLARGMEVGHGSVVLIHSLSHMVRVGTVVYAEDLLQATMRVKTALGPHVIVAPLPGLFVAGCEDEATIRTCAEIDIWCRRVYGGGGEGQLYLEESFGKAALLISKEEGEVGQKDAARTMRLPINTSWPATKGPWQMGGLEIKTRVKLVSLAAEKEIMWKVAGELRKIAALDIEHKPVVTHQIRMAPDPDEPPQKTGYVVLGGGLGLKIGEAIKRTGAEAMVVSIPEWRVNTQNVALLVEKAKSALEGREQYAIILVGLEDSYYQTQSEEGYTMLARKDNDGHFHVDGDLLVVNKEAQMRLFKLMEPIWRLAPKQIMIIISPMIRYLTGSCCADPDHIPNRTAPNFESVIRSSLEGLRNNLKVSLHSSGFHHCRVLDPNMDIATLKREVAWGEDPVVPNDVVFDRIAASLYMVEARVDKRNLSTGAMAAPAAKKSKQLATLPVPASGSDPVPVSQPRSQPRSSTQVQSLMPGAIQMDVRVMDREAEARRARMETREVNESRSSSRSSTRGRGGESNERRGYQRRGQRIEEDQHLGLAEVRGEATAASNVDGEMAMWHAAVVEGEARGGATGGAWGEEGEGEDSTLTTRTITRKTTAATADTGAAIGTEE
jgi:hypothetical protein